MIKYISFFSSFVPNVNIRFIFIKYSLRTRYTVIRKKSKIIKRKLKKNYNMKLKFSKKSFRNKKRILKSFT